MSSSFFRSARSIRYCLSALICVAMLYGFTGPARAVAPKCSENAPPPTCTPACSEINSNPTLPTCRCICDDESSFLGCFGRSLGTAVPTPNQCPDMLQGRRVISLSDTLAIANPRGVETGITAATYLIYPSENQSSNPGLGTINRTPSYEQAPRPGLLD